MFSSLLHTYIVCKRRERKRQVKVYVLNQKSVTKIILAFFLIFTSIIVSKPYFQEISQTMAQKQTRKLPIYCVDNRENKIAVTFDAAWGADDTDDLLRILEKHQVKATFFLVGDWVKRYPEEVKRIAAAGHEIANHSDTHPHVGKMSKEANKKELMDAHQRVKELIGKDMNLFRPPYGEYNDTVLTAAEECGYYTIQWDVDSLDWKEFGVEPLIRQVLDHKHLGSGSIILFHNNAKYTKDALDAILQGLKDKGYTMVPVSELILKENYYMDHEGRQKPIESKN